MVPTTTAATAAAAAATTAIDADANANIPPASTTTPHGKDPNGSTILITPAARPQYIRRDGTDANKDTATTSEETTPGFMSAQLLHYKQQLELA